MRVCELFAGVGGFRLGLEDCSDDFKFVWANQWEPVKKFSMHMIVILKDLEKMKIM